MTINTNKQKGFTLIELIIVIVILGILAVTAAPKFLDLQGDAQGATIEGVAGAMNGVTSIIYGKAIISGVHKTAGAAGVGVDTNGDGTKNVLTAFGYPTAAAGILASLEIDVSATGDFTAAVIDSQYVVSAKGSVAPAVGKIVAGNGTTGDDDDGCYVAYKEAANATTPPVVTINTDEC
ncbi:prepilin-type N-terminal cleavage/methylation domain-containing protein [Pseudoalteromonas denitrificans]|nr:prepilin-type N-terminal cleavage/methylation domain-containing protein [Pseudoalteromonas denitrificans]